MDGSCVLVVSSEAFAVLSGDPVEAGAAVVPGANASCILESTLPRCVAVSVTM